MLKGLKVIDLSTVLAGPSVGTFFAELGAEVIKIEHPKLGDATRNWKLPSEDSNTTISAYFSSVNYKKKYITADLKSKEGLALLLDMVKDADIIISNFKLGDVEKFGITDSILHNINPQLIIGKISGYGIDSSRVAYDLILQAESGFMSMNGTPESGPVKMPVALVDILAAHHLKEGILLSLYNRERTGKGDSISVSLYDTALASLSNQASNYLMTGHIPQRIGSKHPNIAPYGELFTTKDQETITFAIGSNLHFEKLCSVIGLEGIVNSEKFANNQKRVINRVELETIIQDKITAFTSSELLEQLIELNVPVGKVQDLHEVFSSEKAQKLIREEEIDGVKTSRVTSIAFK